MKFRTRDEKTQNRSNPFFRDAWETWVARWWEQNVAHRSRSRKRATLGRWLLWLIHFACQMIITWTKVEKKRHDEKDDNEDHAAEGHVVGEVTQHQQVWCVVLGGGETCCYAAGPKGHFGSVDGFMLVAAPREMLLTYLCLTNRSWRRRYDIPEDCCWRFFSSLKIFSYFF